jgi:hypothetical protein
VQADQVVSGGQEHSMIELVGDRAGHVLERDEINDVVVLVEISFDLDRRAVVVAVQPLTAITFISDEMP